MKFTSDKQRRAVFSRLSRLSNLGNSSQSSECDQFANKFSNYCKFAKQARNTDIYSGILIKPGVSEVIHREKEFGEENLPDVILEDTSKYYYQEPLTVGEKKRVYDPVSRTYISENKYMNKSPTEMIKIPIAGGWDVVPKYGSEYYNNVVMTSLLENTGKDVDELISDGVLTPLSIEYISDKVRDDLADRMEDYSNEVKHVSEYTRVGEFEPYFVGRDKSIDFDVSSITDNKVSDDADKQVISFLKSKGFIKDKSGYYVKE